MTTVKIRPVVEPTALYCRYEGNYEPQPVYVALDLADGALYADYQAGGTPMRVWLGQVRTWSIPPLVADAANELLQDIAPLAQRILDGAAIETDPRTGNRVGVLNDDAAAAEREIYEIIENWREDPAIATVEEIKAAEWYSACDTDPCAEIGLTAETTDDELAQVAARIEQDIRAAAEGVVVVTGAEAWARARRDELQQELRDELEQVTADLAALRARRDELVRRLHACGDSTRVIAELIGTSHTQVRRILGDGGR
ncbi:MAG: hypothetical protein DIU60_023890 [Actinomycetes bacterium]